MKIIIHQHYWSLSGVIIPYSITMSEFVNSSYTNIASRTADSSFVVLFAFLVVYLRIYTSDMTVVRQCFISRQICAVVVHVCSVTCRLLATSVATRYVNNAREGWMECSQTTIIQSTQRVWLVSSSWLPSEVFTF